MLLTADQLNVLIGFGKAVMIAGSLILLGNLCEKISDTWHDRHFHHRRK